MPETTVQNESLRLGRQIRDLRKAKGITLQQMADQLGRSVGYVSQIERGVSVLPVPTLQSISDLLDVKISWFFHGDEQQPENEYGRIVRHDARRALDFAGTGIYEELLSPTLTGDLLMVITTFAANAQTDEAVRKRRAEEAGVVTQGTLELTINGELYSLEEGDSFRLKPEDQYLCRNPSDSEQAKVFWVVSGEY